MFTYASQVFFSVRVLYFTICPKKKKNKFVVKSGDRIDTAKRDENCTTGLSCAKYVIFHPESGGPEEPFGSSSVS